MIAAATIDFACLIFSSFPSAVVSLKAAHVPMKRKVICPNVRRKLVKGRRMPLLILRARLPFTASAFVKNITRLYAVCMRNIPRPTLTTPDLRRFTSSSVDQAPRSLITIKSKATDARIMTTFLTLFTILKPA